MLFIITLKSLNINLTKDGQNFWTGNYKILLWEINEDWNK